MKLGATYLQTSLRFTSVVLGVFHVRLPFSFIVAGALSPTWSSGPNFMALLTAEFCAYNLFERQISALVAR